MFTLENWIFLIVFIAVFPAIWLVAWYWDRVWPTTSELLKRRGEPIRGEDIPK